MTSRGHVFVVRGLIENLDHDATVLPTDPDFWVVRSWASALGVSKDSPLAAEDLAWDAATPTLQPEGWRERRWGRARTGSPDIPLLRPTWFVDASANNNSDGIAGALDDMIDRVRAALLDIADQDDVPVASQRPRPLVALPTLGVGGGGFGDLRGQVIDRLLATSEEVVADAEIDVVFVAASPSDHAAFQARRRAGVRGHGQHVSEELLEHARGMATRAQEGSLALFLGAGVSMSAGLPSWAGLIDQLAAESEVDFGRVTSPLDKAELLRRRLGDDLGHKVADLTQRTARYGLTHALLASFRCEQTVTTNYDTLYERAVQDGDGGLLPVLPYSPARPRSPWLLKMHGDVRHPGTIVLSRSDFVAYDARSRPISSVVQSLLLTRHLLVVGASMTDDNFLRLAHEVVAFKESGRELVPETTTELLGTVVTLQPNPAATELWRDRFQYLATSGDDEESPGMLARRLAIFLDAVAMYATPASHVADERYAALLPDDASRAVAEAARHLRELIGKLPDEDPSWTRLDDALGDVGA